MKKHFAVGLLFLVTLAGPLTLSPSRAIALDADTRFAELFLRAHYEYPKFLDVSLQSKRVRQKAERNKSLAHKGV
jgi:hypothetical protein